MQQTSTACSSSSKKQLILFINEASIPIAMCCEQKLK